MSTIVVCGFFFILALGECLLMLWIAECSVRWTITCAIYQGIVCIGPSLDNNMFDMNYPDAWHLWNPRTFKSHVPLVSSNYVPDCGGTPMEYLRVNALLPVLVLDCWLWKLPCRIHISYVWRLFPDLLHDHCVSCCFDESHCGNRGPCVFFSFFTYHYIVSMAAVSAGAHRRYS